MEVLDDFTEPVHPEVRAHINSLVSALGGSDSKDESGYKLGDDALEVLRDIKRWMRFYDEKTNRMDVARCLADDNLVEGDLIPILTKWTENDAENKSKTRLAVACFEILVPLTWPFDTDMARLTVNHHRHLPVLRQAQLNYKRAIINHDVSRILSQSTRIALTPMTTPLRDRSMRDQGLIKLSLFFLRNIAMIAPSPDMQQEGDESQISRSVTIDAFAYQDIFPVLLTISSSMGTDFNAEDVIIMEIIFHLVKRVDVAKLFLSEQQFHKIQAEELTSLMAKEKKMLGAYNRTAPTRHSRFGTMVWVKREDHRMASISGQQSLVSGSKKQQLIDDGKKSKPAQRKKLEQPVAKDLGPPAKLSTLANDQLRPFIEQFLDSGFNPLFQHIRKTIDNDASHLLHYHPRQFFYLVPWFLEAERARRVCRASNTKDNTVRSYNLIAGVLNQEMFITLSRSLLTSYTQKDWTDLSAIMRCFTQILVTVQEMTESPNEEDRDIAENILARLFYEDSTHDCIATIVRTYKDQDFEYLDAATELAHHFLRILEIYSKKNVDMLVRSRKNVRKKKKTKKTTDASSNEAGQDGVDGEVNNAAGEDDESAEDEENAAATFRERKFDFERFAARFIPQGVIDTFVTLTRNYKDLNDNQLKRAHRFFHRVAFKHEASVMLYRVDIIHLFHGMIKGPEPLDKRSTMYKEWEELIKQILKHCIRKIQERPQLIVEMLFTKIPSTMFYLEKGYEEPVAPTLSRPGAELEFKTTTERDKQVAIAVHAMFDKNENNLVLWVKKILSEALEVRRAWEVAHDAASMAKDRDETVIQTIEQDVPLPDTFDVDTKDVDIRKAMFKNSRLRLLMKLSSITRLAPSLEETPQSQWVIASDVPTDTLIDTVRFIQNAEINPPDYEGVSAESQLRRKTVPRQRAEYDDDSDGIDDDVLFPAGGPTVRKVIDEKRPKATRRRRRNKDLEEGEDGLIDQDVEDEAAAERRRKRIEKARARLLNTKSAAVVNEEDDESDAEGDAEFFAREQAIRERANIAAMVGDDREVKKSQIPHTDSGNKGKRKRIAERDENDNDDDEEEEDDDADRASQNSDVDDDEEEDVSDGNEDKDADSDSDVVLPPSKPTSKPASSSRKQQPPPKHKRRRLPVVLDDDDDNEDDMVDASSLNGIASATLDLTMGENGNDDADADVVVTARRPRAFMGLVIDSDED